MKTLLVNLGALVCAAAVFFGSIVYTAHEVPVEALLPEEKIVEGEHGQDESAEDFWQDDDLLITDLMSVSSEEEIPVSSVEVVESSSKESSKPPSSTASSKKAVSSAAPSSVQAPAPSSAPSSPPPSSEASSEASSEVSSEEEPTPPSGEIDAELLDMLAGAVQREIIGVNTNPSSKYYEAYKAQAVASHSYMVYHKNRTGSYPTMSYCTPKQATLDLVAPILYELMCDSGGNAINASYHAASGGHTQSAFYVWGNDISYLQAAESAYDEYEQTTSLPVSEVQQKLLNYGISTTGDPSSWFDLTNAALTDGGFVQSISICGQAVTGRKLRENILGIANLKSPKIISIEVSNDRFYFSTRGFGHGAGMSQQGALGYAAYDGWDYKQILTHYFSGVTIR